MTTGHTQIGRALAPISRRRAITFSGGTLLGLLAGAGGAREFDAYRQTHRDPTYHVSPVPPRGKNFAAQVLWRTAGPGIAMTFDDGPDSRWTPRILDLLKEHRLVATFFVLNDHALAHPELVTRAAAEGHQIGVHGQDHTDMTTLPPAQLLDQLQTTAATIKRLTGRAPTVMRPPYGRFDAPVLHSASAAGLDVILWSDRFPHTIADDDKAPLAQIDAGSILLCHDGRTSPTDELIGNLHRHLPELAQRFPFRTVAQLRA